MTHDDWIEFCRQIAPIQAEVLRECASEEEMRERLEKAARRLLDEMEVTA